MAFFSYIDYSSRYWCDARIHCVSVINNNPKAVSDISCIKPANGIFFLQKATGGQTDSEDEDLEDEDQSEDEDSKSGLESLVSGGCIRTKHA
jgi:hypothetical protein